MQPVRTFTPVNPTMLQPHELLTNPTRSCRSIEDSTEVDDDFLWLQSEGLRYNFLNPEGNEGDEGVITPSHSAATMARPVSRVRCFSGDPMRP